MQRVTKSHLFDRELFDFENLRLEDADSLPELDIAFDESPALMLARRSGAAK